VRTGAANMALDSAILAAVEAGHAPPTVRIYGFDPPALSLGYAQPDTDIDRDACARLGVDVVRRPTGGRAVLHDRDLTYAVVGPIADPRFGGTLASTYQTIAEALCSALVALGAPDVVLAPRRAGAFAEAACFAAPARAEILLAGRKVAGSAQRRGRRAFLQHGSVLLDPDIPRLAACLRGADAARLSAAMTGLSHVPGLGGITPERVGEAVARALAERLGVDLEPSAPTGAEARHLAG
jgi:lipoate-protein ligase A